MVFLGVESVYESLLDRDGGPVFGSYEGYFVPEAFCIWGEKRNWKSQKCLEL